MKSNSSCTLIDIMKTGERVETGHYVVTNLPDFDQGVFSWNMELDADEMIDISFIVEGKGKVSQSYKLAIWSELEERKSYPKQTGEFGTLNTDVFRPKKRIDKIHIFLKSNTDSSGKNLKGLFLSTMKSALVTEISEEIIEGSCYDVPALVQYPVKSIGSRICSPTSCAMLLKYMGKDVSLEEMASRVYDAGADIYGNWSFNMAAMSAFGLSAYVRYFSSISDLSLFVKNVGPVAVSVKTEKDRGFTEALQTYPSGHLIIVKGFIEKDNKKFVIVNDPADSDQENSQRLYSVEEFKKYWKCIAYVVENREKS